MFAHPVGASVQERAELALSLGQAYLHLVGDGYALHFVGILANNNRS